VRYVPKEIPPIAAADVIFVLEAGRLVEQGRHAELMAARGSYEGLVRAQTEGRIAARPGLELTGSAESLVRGEQPGTPWT
jgi:hypothetical protein